MGGHRTCDFTAFGMRLVVGFPGGWLVLWMDEILQSPPKNAGNDDSPVNTSRQAFHHGFQEVQDFVHPQYVQWAHKNNEFSAQMPRIGANTTEDRDAWDTCCHGCATLGFRSPFSVAPSIRRRNRQDPTLVSPNEMFPTTMLWKSEIRVTTRGSNSINERADKF